MRRSLWQPVHWRSPTTVVPFEDAELEGVGERLGMTATSHDVILRPRSDGS